MNILFLIGNGFDVNIGMETQYSNFYKYYQTIKSDKKIIKDLKQNISEEYENWNRYENWADLELALGDYCKNLKNVDELDTILEDIGINLAKYLEIEENKFKFKELDKKKLLKSFSFPENYLLPVEKNEIVQFKNRWSSSAWNVSVITFNYTNSIENIIGEKYENLKIETNNSHNVLLKKIYHIHGYKNKRMILGVNDKSQINNKSFHNDIDVLEAIVKPESNRAVKDNIDEMCKSEISRANLICIFGSSIGDTDNLWWELIGKRLTSDLTKLIIFRRSSKLISDRISQKNQREVRKRLNEFLAKTNLNDKEKKIIRKKIIVSINASIFDI